ncbi:MAG TPA: FKBP-type peptidyl-prolyl cis-trans isomerase [Candidatus Saccharimonadales bacterium]|nr:FKBP-type peptidyl-prolyl cis-trans isomerase [Candidatus Saccharimonadales bacterium]
MSFSGEAFSRYFIFFIAIVFIVGTIGFYLYTVFSSNNTTPTNSAATSTAQQNAQASEPVNKAYIIKGPVSALQSTDITQGNGDVVSSNATILASYVGALASTGQIFDQSKTPVQFSLSSVIKGWQQGIPGMKVGGTRRLVIPSSLGYGSAGTPDGSIPPNAALVFDVTVTKIVSN